MSSKNTSFPLLPVPSRGEPLLTPCWPRRKKRAGHRGGAWGLGHLRHGRGTERGRDAAGAAVTGHPAVKGKIQKTQLI